MALDLEALKAEVARNTTIAGSVQQVVNTLRGQVESLTQQISQNGVDPATLSALADLQKTLKANDDLVDAIVQNTPAGGSTDAGGGADTVSGGAGADTTGAAQGPSQAPADPNAPAGPTG